MAISKKRAPRVDNIQLNRVISKIYDDINELINAVNKGDVSTNIDNYVGKEGDLRLVRESDGTYEIQGKTKEGWSFVKTEFKQK
jgi:hypothetical protein